jgi:plastocyanin
VNTRWAKTAYKELRNPRSRGQIFFLPSIHTHPLPTSELPSIQAIDRVAASTSTFLITTTTTKMHSALSSTALIFGVLATSVLATPQYDYGGGGSSTSSAGSSTATAAAASVSGVHSVKVGPALDFTPDTVKAAVGDWIEYTFTGGHSVAQSSFGAPCMPISGSAGVFSGFPNNGDVWRFQVNSTDPLWLYCSTTGHCEAGMAMVVNPP